VGVYSVLAYATTQKTHEIGVRMALGAERSAVLGMVVRAGWRLVMAGVVVGIGVSLVLVRFIETQLAGMTAYDPATLAATTAPSPAGFRRGGWRGSILWSRCATNSR
jgi:putative ABC transport system permease protein